MSSHDSLQVPFLPNVITPQLGYHHSPGSHGTQQVPSNHKGRLLPLQPVHGAPAINITPLTLSTLHETSESSSNGSLSLTNTPDTLTEKVVKVSNSEKEKFSDDSLDGAGVASNHLNPPHPHNVVVNRAFREGSQTLSPIWHLGRQLPNDEIEESSSSGNSDYITSYIGRQTPQPHLHPPQSPTRYGCPSLIVAIVTVVLLVHVVLVTVVKVRVTQNRTHLVILMMNLAHMS